MFERFDGEWNGDNGKVTLTEVYFQDETNEMKVSLIPLLLIVSRCFHHFSQLFLRNTFVSYISLIF